MKKSPREKAWVLSKLYFWWVWDILRLGSKRELELDDMYQVLDSDRSQDLGNRLETAWNTELNKSQFSFGKWPDSDTQLLLDNAGTNQKPQRRPGFGRALWAVFGFKFCLLGLVAFVDECFLKIVQPLLLGQLIRYFGGDESLTSTDGYLYATGVILCSAWYLTQHHPYFFGLQHTGMRSRCAVSSVVYRKILRLSVTAVETTTVGQMVNFLSNDVSRFDQAPLMFWYLFVAPIQLVIVVYILWGFYSYICLVGIGFLVLFVPFQSFMGNLFGRMRRTVAGKTDKRIRIMNEIVSAIKVIKMYTWEEPFAQLVKEARADEVGSLRIVAYLKAVNMSIFNVSSKIVIFLTLLTYVLTGNYLTAEKVFVTLALYNNVRMVLTLFFPFAISFLAELLISIRRLENFLLLEERDALNVATGRITNTVPDELDFKKRRPSGGVGVIVQNLKATWTPKSEDWTLDNVSTQVKRGQLVAVIGTVGSSKSSLLQAILGELPCAAGRIQVNGQLAFASQEPWIFSGTVRSNILFGKRYDPVWYSKVVEACALMKDFELLPYGDSSLVGDRGIALSGGQKARVNLARAVYADRDIYLLDDPLSAVDAEVGKHLFEKCIRGILHKKAVILVTHQLQFLRPADEVLVLNGGKVETQGSYFKLKTSGVDLVQLLHTEEPSEKPLLTTLAVQKPGLRKISSDAALRSRITSVEMNVFGDVPGHLTEFEDDDAFSMSLTKSFGQGVTAQQKTEQDALASTVSGYGTFEAKCDSSVDKVVIPEELRSSGSISMSVYWKYMRTGGNCCSLFILICSGVLAQIAFTGSDFWLQFWTQAEENLANPTNPVNGTVTKSWLDHVYQSLLHNRDAQASVNLHKGLFQGVIRSPMSFFDKNPIGRILNRFARDVGVIDEYLPATLFDTWEIPFNGIGVLAVVGIVSPILILPAIGLLIIFYYVRRFYLKSARSLKRLESITRSPVFTQLSASFHGLATIRALGVQATFIRDFDRLQDNHSACWYLFLSTSRWLGITLDWVAVFYVTIVTFSFMWSDVDGSQVGLAVTSALTLTGLFQWGVRQSAETENHMVSVERVFEYAELESEPPLESSPDRKPPPDWPSRGEIEMKNLDLRYGEDEPVLKGISLKINSMEKVGIVGRTGAGKSSFISTLFRTVDPSQGSVQIDSLDIVTIGLHDLRSKISIIPQDPVLFLGSLRRNLDPFAQFTDLELWNALEDVHLKESVLDLQSGLNSPISEGGSNFSVGERQLICLARAILRNNKILVLDEATANVDPTTDALIQATIRTKFRFCTVLTVAHRLYTVIDSDRILVLDAGRVVEFDRPWTLLQNPDGSLFQLAQQTGTDSAEALTRVAKEAFERRLNNDVQNSQE